MKSPIEQHDIEPGKYAEQSVVMAMAMIKSVGPEVAIGSTTALLEELLICVLHQETPMAEVNIASIETLLDKMKERVMVHKQCALELNKLDPKKAS